MVSLFPAIAIAVLLSGHRAALVPAVAGFILCDRLFSDTPWLSVQSLVSALGFGSAAGAVIWSGEAMRHGRALAQARKELLEVTLRSIGDAVITTDSKGCITDLNPVAVDLTGWKAHEAIGRPVTEVLS